jgi:hypothetical protein
MEDCSGSIKHKQTPAADDHQGYKHLNICMCSHHHSDASTEQTKTLKKSTQEEGSDFFFGAVER